MSVSILGGGISGLSACHFLKKSPKSSNLKVSLFEKSKRPGGWIETKTENGFTFEVGARSIRTMSGKRIFDILEDLKLENDMIHPSKTSSKKMIYLNNRINILPNSFFTIFKSPLTRPHLFQIFQGLTKKHNLTNEDETVKEFFERYLGIEITKNIIATSYTGIYAGNIAKLSMKSTNPQLYNISRKHGRFIRAMASKLDSTEQLPTSKLKVKLLNRNVEFYNFKGGLNTFINNIAQEYENLITYEREVKALYFPSKNKIIMEFDGIDTPHESDYIISTIPSYSLAKLLRPHHEHLAKILDSIEYASIATVSFGFDKKIIPEDLEGFGYLVAPSERSKVLGATFDSISFPEKEDETRLTFMIGGDISTHDNVVDVTKSTKEELIKVALEALENHLNIRDSPTAISVNICKNAIPQFSLNYEKKISEIKDILNRDFPNIVLSGAYMKDISINGCVDNSYDVVSDLLERID